MDELRWDGLVTFESRIDDAIVGALQGQDLSGFEIWRWLGSKEGASGPLTEALLYPTLYHLEAEGLLQSAWHEGEWTKRKYRLTATASGQTSRGDQRVPAAPPADRRAVSPDPEAGAWFMPPREQPPVASPAAATASAATPRTDGHANGQPPAAAESSARRRPDAPGWAALAAYADELGARLDLPRAEQNRVRHEIADHLRDSAHSLERQGHDPEAAATEALRLLGPSAALANAIEQAQQTPSRFKRGIRRGVLEIVGEMAFWLALSIVPFALAPGLLDIVTGLGRVAGLHLVVLRTAEWTTSQAALMVCAGAFAAGRISLGRLARISRHNEATFRKRWALGGAAVLLAIVLVAPGYQDGLTVVTLLAVPVAFVAGSLRPQQFRESAYSVRGVAAAALVVVVVTFLPAVRLFDFDPNGTPGTPLAQGGATVILSVDSHPDGTFTYGLPEQTGTGSVTVELWQASTDWPFIVVDRSATAAVRSVQPGSGVDLAALPPYRQWWVVAVSTAPDGTRTALAVAIQTGTASKPGTVLGWLISRL
jgi:DNA-binding PadR family transcriptional regulator